MPKTRKLFLSLFVLSAAAAVCGCHVARKPVVLIEPSFSYLTAENAPGRGEPATFQIAAVSAEGRP